MKFYYNGKLVRTSKNHEYKYASINKKTGKAYSCSTTKEGAGAEINRRINEAKRNIANYEKCIDAINKNYPYIFIKTGRTDYKVVLKGKTVEEYEKWIGYNKEDLEYYSTNFEIVELEMKD